MTKLTEKQKRFADFYIESGNATEAAIKAGYSKRSAKETGYENLTKPHISAYIDERIKEKDAERIASQNEVLELLTSIMRGQIEDATIKERLKAAELIGKRYRLFDPKNNDDPQNINITVRTPEETKYVAKWGE